MLVLDNVPAGSTIYIPFATYNANGASVTMTGLLVTDIEIYKNGSATQRASDNGYALLDTDGIDFDGITGIHGFSVNLNDNSDSGFYAVGSWYWVVVSSITADGQTVNFIAAVFRISPAESQTGYPKVDLDYWRGTQPNALTSSRVDVSVGAMAAGVVTSAAVATGAIDADALAADAVDEILDEVVEGSTTLRQMLRGFASALLAKASGLETTTAVYRDIGDTKDRITATVDDDGNRSAVTLDLT